MAGTHFKGPIVHGPQSTNVNKYAYRQNLGMMPSAEFNVFHDDFVSNVTSNIPTGWTGAVIDTGATVSTTTNAEGKTGALSIFDATASEGAAIYMPKAVQITSGKKFFIEARVYISDVTDHTFQFGLSDLTATTNPEDLYTTTAANLISLGILDGSAVLGMLSDLSNSGTSVQAADSATGTLSASTWHTVAISYDGNTGLAAWLDGNKCLTWSSTFASTVPVDTFMAPFLASRNGNGAGSNVVLVDYLRLIQER